MNRTRHRSPVPDKACLEAVDLARSVAAEIGRPEWVGDHITAHIEGDRLVTHYFACLARAYTGWQYAVTVVRAAWAKYVTVNEAVLIPGPDSLLPPEWLPWKERLRPGDLGVGDILPTAPDDERLVPGHADVPGDTDATADDSDDAATGVVWDLGLGRARVLSPVGRAEAAERWYEGDSGPRTPIATAAPAQCATCGFLVPLSGELGQVFGVCANEYAPDDGRVVAMDHGCGAHSEAALPPQPSGPAPPIVDEMGYDTITDDDLSELELVSPGGDPTA